MPPAPEDQPVVSQHPGSSAAEIASEPDWKRVSNHRAGFRNYHSSHIAGLTHHEDAWSEEEIAHARELFEQLSDEEKQKKLVDWQEVMSKVTDFHLRTNENPMATQSQAQAARGGNAKESDSTKGKQDSQNEKEDRQDDDKDTRSEYQKLLDEYTPEQKALLRALEHERDYISKLENDDGKSYSPQKHNRSTISIDEQDAMTPDNWIPRAQNLIRLAGSHPCNSEPPLTSLYDAGLITPNEVHYVRNHGAVPHLIWELHKISFQHGKAELSMDDLKHKFDQVNIPIALACDGSRRKEYNMVRTTQFGWGAGGVSNAFWKGPLLRDLLLALIPDDCMVEPGKRRSVNFAGADAPSEGRYETCIPLEYALNPDNDVLITWGMNCHEEADVHLPADHGYPARLMIPGWVGGRCVKWLKEIWISDKENDSYYHIWDNRVVPSFIKSKKDPMAEALFRNPDSACNEQMLNSVITKPAEGEKIAMSKAKKGSCSGTSSTRSRRRSRTSSRSRTSCRSRATSGRARRAMSMPTSLEKRSLTRMKATTGSFHVRAAATDSEGRVARCARLGIQRRRELLRLSIMHEHCLYISAHTGT